MAWETRVQSQVKSYQRLKKWQLMPPFLTLSIIRYGLRINGAIQGKEWHPPQSFGIIAIEKEGFGSPSTIVGQLINIYIYIYIVSVFIYMYMLVYSYLPIHLSFIHIHISADLCTIKEREREREKYRCSHAYLYMQIYILKLCVIPIQKIETAM